MAPPTTEVSGNLVLVKDPDMTLVPTIGGQLTIDYLAAWNLVRAAAGDYYDFVSFFLDTQSGMPATLGAASFSIFNDVLGVGRPTYDNRASYSSTRLQHIEHYDQTYFGAPVNYMTTLLHETAHRWLYYVDFKDAGGVTSGLLHEDWIWSAGQKSVHPGRWVDDSNSCMGYDQAQWIDNGNGTFNRIQHDPTVDDAWFGYSLLDLYLMGLIPASSVSNFKIVQNPSPALMWGSGGPYTPSPSALAINASNVQAEEGVRSPDYLNSQRVFHKVIAVISKSTAAASANPYMPLAEDWRKRHANSFRAATGGRAFIDTSLLRSNYPDLYVKDNAADTGSGSSTGQFWLSPDLWVRNAADGITSDQPAIRGQDNYVYVRVRNKGAQPYSNVVVNVYIANFESLVPGTEFLYPVDWAPGGLIDTVTIANVPAASGGVDGETIANVTWLSAKIPPAAGWHPCLLCEVLPMETAPIKLHHVWENKKLAQRNITII